MCLPREVRGLLILHFCKVFGGFALNALCWCPDFKQLTWALLCDDGVCETPCKQKSLPQSMISL